MILIMKRDGVHVFIYITILYNILLCTVFEIGNRLKLLQTKLKENRLVTKVNS